MSKSEKWLFIPAAVFLSISLAFAGDIWDRHLVLDDDRAFHVYWAQKEKGIVFKVEAATKGYVVFGLSPNGGMTGSDVVTGWIADGEVHFQDRHGVGNSFPPVDKSQDWFLMNGWENDTHTSLTFYRDFVTCDPDDIDIDDNTIHLIYAYSPKDPTSEDTLTYDGINRGTRPVYLLQGKVYHRKNLDGIPYWDVKAPGFAVTPKDEDVVLSTICRGPELNAKHHVVQIEPLIQPGNEKHVGHIAIFECMGEGLEEVKTFLNHPGLHLNPETQKILLPCKTLLTFWGFGGNGISYPENTGFPLPAGTPKYYRLDIHYRNPFLNESFRDSSGMRLFHTEDLRQYDAGLLGIVSSSIPTFFIPPLLDDFTLLVHSSPERFRKEMAPNGIKIFASLVHAHHAGRRVRVRHFRGNVELPPLADDTNYEYHNQDYKYHDKEALVLPSDMITVECTYNTSEISEITLMGTNRSHEMCATMLLYYPKTEVNLCLSAPVITTTTKLIGMPEEELRQKFGNAEHHIFPQVEKILKAIDWKFVNASALEEAFIYAPQASKCFPGNKEMKELATFPRKFVPFYRNTRKCSKDAEKEIENFERQMDNFIEGA